MKEALHCTLDFFLDDVFLVQDLLIVIPIIPIRPALPLGLLLFHFILFDLGHFPHSKLLLQDSELRCVGCGVPFTQIIAFFRIVPEMLRVIERFGERNGTIGASLAHVELCGVTRAVIVMVICLAQHVPIAVSDWSMRCFAPGCVFPKRTRITTQIVWRKEFFWGIGLLQERSRSHGL
jgi:hypothetical protein